MGEIRVKSENLFDIGTNVNDYGRPDSMVSVTPSAVAMKLENSGLTVHYRLQNITTTGTVTIYCKGSVSMPRLYLRLRSTDDTRWLTNSDVSISGMVYNSVYNGWFNDVFSNIFIKTIVIPDCLYWNLGLGFNSGAGQVGNTVSIINPIVVKGTYTSETIPPYQPYFLTLPSHKKTSTGWKDIPTHTMTATGWQGELTSQSPLEFRATGQSLLDWRIDGASGGVGDWDETEQKYVIPVNVRSKNLFDSGFVVAGTIGAGGFPASVGEPRKTWFGDVESGKTYKFTLTNNNRCAIVGYNQRHTQAEMEAYTPSNQLPSDVEIYVDYTTVNTTIAITIPNNVVMIGVYYATGSAPAAMLEVYYDTTTNLYTDHQLMDGDSLDFATDQTSIPITQGDNTLTVGTQVQPKSVFVKFEG